METSAKKSKKVDKKEAFAEVFEKQARRFSAFDLLGIESSPLPSAQDSTSTGGRYDDEDVSGSISRDFTAISFEKNNNTAPSLVHGTNSKAPGYGTLNYAETIAFDQGRAKRSQEGAANTIREETEKNVNDSLVSTGIWREKGTNASVPSPSLKLGTDGKELVHRTNSYSYEQGLNGQIPVHTTDHLSQVKRPDGSETLGSDPSEGRTDCGQHLDQMVRSSYEQTQVNLGQTKEAKTSQELRLNSSSVALVPDHTAILLAPVQWQVWEVLQKFANTQPIISYRQIAKQTKSTIEGVRKAIRVIQKEGGIINKEVIRTAEEQGVKLTINPNIRFRTGSLNEAKGILKRGLNLGHTPTYQSQVHGTDGAGMYVCRNLNIRQTDLVKLLHIPPLEWKIREQTLIQIAEALPEMTALEFRLSLSYLVEQAKTAKEPIRHPNAWVKASFEKNGAPLVTEREIETRFTQQTIRSEATQRRSEEREMSQELELMRRYLACEPEERSEIDHVAAQKAAPLLKIVSDDKRAGVLDEARITALKEFFSRRGKT
jgi:hypothetical protein